MIRHQPPSTDYLPPTHRQSPPTTVHPPGLIPKPRLFVALSGSTILHPLCRIGSGARRCDSGRLRDEEPRSVESGGGVGGSGGDSESRGGELPRLLPLRGEVEREPAPPTESLSEFEPAPSTSHLPRVRKCRLCEIQIATCVSSPKFQQNWQRCGTSTFVSQTLCVTNNHHEAWRASG